MPKRDDINTILLVGSGPIVIGQACEFDYSGTQAVMVLKELGYRVVLINSNPATIMTDPSLCDATYIEPIHKNIIKNIIEKERVDAIVPTMGGQTSLNVVMDMYDQGMLDGMKFLGASPQAIQKGEDRKVFKKIMKEIGIDTPKSIYAYSIQEALLASDKIGFPLIIRASYTLGGEGSAIVYSANEFRDFAMRGLKLSPINEILIEESLIGWKEYELEVMRDRADNCIVVCSIENIDPLGVHTGDSITVAPSLTLTDKEYQSMRSMSFKVLRKIGIDTGGSNVQFAVNPSNGKTYIIEMNPRVSRSSALASKATGYPIARIAMLLAVGFTLDEITNDISNTPASFEPTIDYIVTKIPRFAFEKFPASNPFLTTSMKSIGEVMSIGGSFKESIQKALCSLENGLDGFEEMVCNLPHLIKMIKNPNENRLLYIAQAFREGISVEEVYEHSNIDRWFLYQIRDIVELENSIDIESLRDKELFRKIKSYGFSDRMIAKLLNKRDKVEVSEYDIKSARKNLDINLEYENVDTCSAEFHTTMSYKYSVVNISSFKSIKDSIKKSSSVLCKKVLIIGSGPNRIGQGIEFDYCCVHASFALREMGIKSIMYNCNPETVSTDYRISDVLYFEPVDFERVSEAIEQEQPYGVIVSFGGQTAIKLANKLYLAKANIIGTSREAIDIAEDREKFSKFILDNGLLQPKNAFSSTKKDALLKAKEIGYPVIVRPSYVLGGRAMRIIYSNEELLSYIDDNTSNIGEYSILIDKFLEDSIEIDVDAISDKSDVYIGAIIEHIEEAGIHSGDSACFLPTINIKKEIIKNIEIITKKVALKLNILGPLNIQFALSNDKIYIIEVNPRASRTIPFVSKATAMPLAKIATRVMLGQSLKEALDFYDEHSIVYKGNGVYKSKMFNNVASKESIFSFNKIEGSDLILGPEMKSTGEVMAIADSPSASFSKVQLAANNSLPNEGNLFLSLKDEDKQKAKNLARSFIRHGFKIFATPGTKRVLCENGIESTLVLKIGQGRPNIEDRLINKDISIVINTSDNESSKDDAKKIRRLILRLKIPYFTTLSGANMAIKAIINSKKEDCFKPKSIQEHLTFET